ncbi:reverse transcriptase domain-containing protein, partial [Klebsiella pneumoniae]|uniref:reverse transcriptase domain-containing protein n=1 Tax=Klebsiella pneumoniae TaxID=573 RepID=UPI003013BEE8
LVYVDDVIIKGNNNHLISRLVATLYKMFALKDLGKLNYFLGIQVQYLGHGFILNQLKYVDDLLQRIGLSNLKPVASPSNLGKHLSINDRV